MMPQINLKLIKELREERGFSQQEMANYLHLSGGDKYSRRENGVYNFKASELPLLAKKLGVSIERLFKNF